MELPALVSVIALLEYMFFAFKVGLGRDKFDVQAPAVSGHPEWERLFRVQQNTVEQLVVFLPALFLFATYASEAVAAALGLVFILGRALYARGYVLDPAKRGPGFLLTVIANFCLLLGGLIGAVLASR